MNQYHIISSVLGESEYNDLLLLQEFGLFTVVQFKTNCICPRVILTTKTN